MSLIDDWHTARAAYRDANHTGTTVRQHNRLLGTVRRLAAHIAQDPELWPVIESRCGADQTPEERLDAALVREHWDLRGAAHTYVDIIREAGAAVHRPITVSAALAFRPDPVAWTAGMCLANIDTGTGNVTPSRRHGSPATEVDAQDLNAIEEVHALAANGGVDHAFHVAGARFTSAIRALEALGLSAAAAVLRDLIELGGNGVTAESRAEALERLDESQLAELIARYAVLSDPIDELLDAE